LTFPQLDLSLMAERVEHRDHGAHLQSSAVDRRVECFARRPALQHQVFSGLQFDAVAQQHFGVPIDRIGPHHGARRAEQSDKNEHHDSHGCSFRSSEVGGLSFFDLNMAMTGADAYAPRPTPARFPSHEYPHSL
jgi:hypothetical protein